MSAAQADGKNILLINAFGTPTSILEELLSGSSADSNIYLSYPLGVLTLAAWCRQEFPGFNIKIVDVMMELHKRISNPVQRAAATACLDDFIAGVLDRVDFTPDFIGISLSFSNGHRPCLKLSGACRKRWPGAAIIAGGVHATTYTRRIIADPDIDYVVRGPGDEAFVALLRSLLAGRSPDGIRGVVTGAGNAATIAPPLDDLNRIPPYPYDLLDMEYLVVNESTSPIREEFTRTGMIFMSRGCPFGCSFCSADKVHGKKVAFINVERMVGEVEYLMANFGVNTICIIDDLFGADKQYFREFFRLVDDRGLKFRTVVPGGLSVAVFNEEMIDILVEHGLKAVYFPIESGSRHVQSHIIKKRVDLDKAVRLISYTKGKGLFTGINIVLGSPGETREMMDETYEFIRKLPVDAIAFFMAFPYPGTEMTNILLDRGEITEEGLVEIWDSSTQGFKQRPFDTREISGRELSELVYDFNIRLNFFFNYNIANRNYQAIIPKYDKIIERYPFHVIALACRAKCNYELGEMDAVLNDMRMIIELVGRNSESLRLFKRYRAWIVDMLDFFDLGANWAKAGNAGAPGEGPAAGPERPGTAAVK